MYASDISGMGFTLDPDFANLGRGFFTLSDDEAEPQAPIAYTFTFTQNPYSEYQAFVDWVLASGKLTLIYNPTGTQEYCRNVYLASLEKGELNQMGWLEVPCRFLCETPWYLPVPSSMALEVEDATTIKRYHYQYTDALKYGSDGYPALSATVPNSGHIPAAVEIAYHGKIVNPVIRLTGKLSGQTIGVCAIGATLENADTLKVSTRYEDSYVKKVSAGGAVTDLLDALDLRLNPFFRIPVSEPCEISIESDESISGRAELLIYYYFRSV